MRTDADREVDQKPRVRTGHFRVLVVGSGDAIRQPGVNATTEPIAVESDVGPARLSPRIGAFSIGGNS